MSVEAAVVVTPSAHALRLEVEEKIKSKRHGARKNVTATATGKN